MKFKKTKHKIRELWYKNLNAKFKLFNINNKDKKLAKKRSEFIYPAILYDSGWSSEIAFNKPSPSPATGFGNATEKENQKIADYADFSYTKILNIPDDLLFCINVSILIKPVDDDAEIRTIIYPEETSQPRSGLVTGAETIHFWFKIAKNKYLLHVYYDNIFQIARATEKNYYPIYQYYPEFKIIGYNIRYKAKKFKTKLLVTFSNPLKYYEIQKYKK